jgi:hypothetical protein
MTTNLGTWQTDDEVFAKMLGLKQQPQAIIFKAKPTEQVSML